MKRDDPTLPELNGMISQDGEVVPFIKTLKTSGQKGVEGMLKEIMDAMVDTVKRKIKDAYNELTKTGQEKTEWLKVHCGQAIAVCSMIIWTEQVEEAILTMEDDPFAL